LKKIICPTDFSDVAQHAAVYAAKLAHRVGAQLTLLHIKPLSESVALIANDESYQSPLEKTLQDQCLQISRTFKIGCYAEIKPQGLSLTDTIVRYTAEHDLLVMGTDGPSNFFESLSGSSTYKTVVESEIPAIIVPAGCLYSEIEKIVYTTTYLSEKKLPLQQLVPFIQMLGARLTVLQVTPDLASQDMEVELRELQAILTARMGEGISVSFETIRSSHVAGSINQYVTDHNPDMLAIRAVRRNVIGKLFHHSILKDLSTVAAYPVFAFHK
jgi:nucleotide-binding universal stress UspA family protein